jgi:phospholipid/cholesterol/gamma-HCH transport system ATP-binding protein
MADVTGVTSLVVSHDVTSILGIADKVALLYGGQLRFAGTPQELGASADPVANQFIHGAAEGPIGT